MSKSVGFRDLGLLIVDEEQHFGVKQKERLKQLRADVHVLTLTATPIPRTLQLAMSGVRDMSLIATPPVDRLAVRTFVLPYDPVIVREAILREHFRGGQVFYVCPRIEDLPELEERLKKLVPEIKVGVAHGQLAAGALEAVMTAFYEGRYDVLLSTNIVESGLDIPTANTLIVHRADMFGLAQLYQLRGRVGRSKVRAYALLTTPVKRPLTQTAYKRLEVLQSLDALGAGFSLASLLRVQDALGLEDEGRSAVLVFLSGGPAHQDTFDLKPAAPAEYRGQFRPIKTATAGVEICEHLPRLARRSDKYAVLRGVSHNLAAHGLGTRYCCRTASSIRATAVAIFVCASAAAARPWCCCTATRKPT